MFGAKYSRLKFWIWSIILLLLISILSVFIKATETSVELAVSNLFIRGLFLLVVIIWMNSLANRIRDYGSSPWISLFALLPLANIGLALYYGIAKAKNKPENNENINQKDTSLTKAVYNHSKDIASEIKPAINEYKEKHSYSNTSSKETITPISNNLEISEDEIYEKIMIEIEEDKKVKSTWAKALAQSDGDRDKAESLYIKLRVHKFKTEHIIYMEEKNNVMRDEKEKLKALKVNKEKIDSKSKIFKYVYDIPADIKIQLISKYTLGNPYEDNEQIKYIFKDKSTGEECVLKYCDNFYVLFSNDKRKEEIFHIKNKSIYLVKNNEVENNVPKPKNLDYATKFLEKYDCTEKSINVIIDNKIIRVRNKLN